jgi:excisionase family DNA binding protein
MNEISEMICVYENKGNDVLVKYKDLLSVMDLAEIFEVSKNTIYKSIQDGKFGSPIQIGRAYKVPKSYIIKNFFCR